MGVEGGGLAGGIGGSIGAEAGGGLGPGISGLGSLAPLSAETGLGSTIVNERPATAGFMEHTMPLQIGPMNEIVFKPSEPSLIAQAEEVAAKAWEKSELPASPASPASRGERGEPTPQEAVYQAEAIVSAAQKPVIEPVVFPKVEPMIVPLVIPKLEPEPVLYPAVSPALEPVAQTATKTGTKTAPAILPRPLFQEEEVEEDVLVENRIKEESEISEEEETEEYEIRDLLDEQVSEQRVYDIGKAVDSAGAEAEKEGVSGIEGWRIVKFIRLHIGLISEIVRKIGRDGSLDETIEELAVGQFESEEEAKKQSRVIVSQNEPVKWGKDGDGKRVRKEAVPKVLKYQLDKGSPAGRVVLRVEKKRKAQVKRQEHVQLLPTETSEVRESSLEELSPELAGVFQKAA